MQSKMSWNGLWIWKSAAQALLQSHPPSTFGFCMHCWKLHGRGQWIPNLESGRVASQNINLRIMFWKKPFWEKKRCSKHTPHLPNDFNMQINPTGMEYRAQLWCQTTCNILRRMNNGRCIHSRFAKAEYAVYIFVGVAHTQKILAGCGPHPSLGHCR